MDETAIVIVDAAGLIRFWSRGAEKAFGYLAEFALGLSLDLIVPEEFRKQHWQGFRRAMVAGFARLENQSSDFPVCTSGGAIVTRPGRLTLLRGMEGKLLGAMVIFS